MPSAVIIECSEPTELFRHFDGQTAAQSAYVELGLKRGRVYADYNGEIGNAAPFTAAPGFDRRYPVPVLHAAAANRVLREITPLVERILNDWTSEWDGSNHVAVLGPDAQTAEAEIEDHLGVDSSDKEQGFADSDLVAQWGIEGAVNGEEISQYGITTSTSDERLDEIEADILSHLAGCGDSPVAVCAELGAWLRDRRDELSEND